MKRLIPIVLLALLCGFSPAMQTVLFSGGNRPYVGPGDVFSGAAAWYSTQRAYTKAYAAGGASAKAFRVVKTSDGSGGCDVLLSASGFITASPATQCPTECSVQCSVTTIYDQSGNAKDAVQATLAQMPVLIQSDATLGSKPTLNCGTGGVFVLLTSGTVAGAEPSTFSYVATRITTGVAGATIGYQSLGLYVGASATNNTAQLFPGTTLLSATASDNAWHGINDLMNGASSIINVDGSESAPGGAGSAAGASTVGICRTSAGGQFRGSIAEAGVWIKTSTSTDRGNLYANQHGSNGYNGAF